MQLLVLVALLWSALPLWAGKRALLIGVNDYTYGPAEWDLRGCENDVTMARKLLIDKFGFPAENVKVLLNGEATAQNILESIQDWLVAPGMPDDVAYFHFSGHGSQAYDEDRDEDDGRDELICPADMQEGRFSTVITDDQLKVALRKIPARSLTIVLDACHSGTGTRDLSLSRPRFVVFDPSLARTRGIAIPAAAPAEDKLAGSGGLEGQRKGQVTISGCKPDQTSADAWIREGFYAGALTYHLVESMKKAPPGATYRELMERVARDIQGANYIQIPQLEGDIDQLLLGEGTAEAAIVPFELVKAENLNLLLESVEKTLADSLQEALSHLDFVEVVKEGKHFDHRLQASAPNGGLSAVLTVDGKAGVPAEARGVVGLMEALRPQLENAYAFKFLAALDNPEPPFEVEVWANRIEEGETQEKPAGEKLLQTRIGELIQFNFRAERDCYLTLLDLGTSGKITVLFPNQYRPDGAIEGGKVYQTGAKGELPFQIRATGPSGRELVKVIATLEPLDLASLQLGEAGGAGTRTIESGSRFVRQLVRDLSVEAAETEPEEMAVPKDRWATDYLIVESTP